MSDLEFSDQHKHIAYIQKLLNNLECEILQINDENVYLDLQKKCASLEMKFQHLMRRGNLTTSEFTSNYGKKLNKIKTAIIDFREKITGIPTSEPVVLPAYDFSFIGSDNDNDNDNNSNDSSCLFSEEPLAIDEDTNEITDGKIVYHPSDVSNFPNGQINTAYDTVLLRGLQFSIGNIETNNSTLSTERNYLVITFRDPQLGIRRISLPFETVVS
jgi:hypothetical protein